jgi:hypothetical protein
MRTEKLINILSIKMDRYPMNPTTLELIDRLRGGGSVPAIKVAKLPQGGSLIRDGRHRVLAYRLLGEKEILAKFSDKPLRKKFIKEK